VVICLERGADCHCIPKPHRLLPRVNPDCFFTFLVPAYAGFPGKEAVKRGVVVVVVVAVAAATETSE